MEFGHTGSTDDYLLIESAQSPAGQRYGPEKRAGHFLLFFGTNLENVLLCSLQHIAWIAQDTGGIP